MDANSPSSAASYSPPSTAPTTPPQIDATECWPAKPVVLHGRYFSIRPLQPDDATDLWPLLADEENVRLFKQTYGRTYSNFVDFKVLMADAQRSSYGSVTYTIISQQTRKPVGWLLLHSLTTYPAKCLEYALFIQKHQRSESVFDAGVTINVFLFEVLGYDKLVFRRGSRSEECGQGANQLGFTLVGILRRQMLVKDRSTFTDCYTITREQFPGAKEAIGAYLDSHPLVAGGDV
ncbi:hypothetical protein LTR36_002808 [Oleoguttula mirabilis]|uniref:N-acetyltransferase domain-containing protein n=1 Tax=Oleoguttula mirabilis TaxID=1507867 RepID=A0AAV9JJK3_9PEZI|nr:hypothetical protein LTR36_002808 [Oleoguttula mirabilis]